MAGIDPINPLAMFEKFLYEAPGDDPPEMDDTGPPDIPDDAANDTGPPDMDDGAGFDDGTSDMDMEGDGSNEFGDGDGLEDMTNNEANMELDAKVSAILNMNLYQRFLALLNNIGSQLSMIKDNSDMFHTISEDSMDIVSDLKKLDENVHIYLKSFFTNENYSKNLFFFNKCLNLLKLLNDSFNEKIKKGIKSL